MRWQSSYIFQYVTVYGSVIAETGEQHAHYNGSGIHQQLSACHRLEDIFKMIISGLIFQLLVSTYELTLYRADISFNNRVEFINGKPSKMSRFILRNK